MRNKWFRIFQAIVFSLLALIVLILWLYYKEDIGYYFFWESKEVIIERQKNIERNKKIEEEKILKELNSWKLSINNYANDLSIDFLIKKKESWSEWEKYLLILEKDINYLVQKFNKEKYFYRNKEHIWAICINGSKENKKIFLKNIFIVNLISFKDFKKYWKLFDKMLLRIDEWRLNIPFEKWIKISSKSTIFTSDRGNLCYLNIK